MRAGGLGSESFGEDELNKLQTVEEYRTNGLSGKNGEHPFLMKGLQTLSVSVAESLGRRGITADISDEAALRFPVALIGTFSTLLIFLIVSELFGRSTALVAAALWAVEPMAIGFDRVAKEDSLVLFFFLLTNLFWIKGQTAAERGSTGWITYIWLSAAGFAALMASKYYPHLIAIMGAYYNVFKHVPAKKWNVGKGRWPMFFVVMGFTFLVLNPTIVLPETWREMLKFSSENRIAHDSYEFMGELHRNQMTAWLSGVPWTFYYVFIAVKTSLSTLILALIGLPLLFQRRFGDGRFFLFFWAFMWFLPFTFLGGKFTRYFTLVEPLVLIAAAVAAVFITKWISDRLTSRSAAVAFQVFALAAVVVVPLWNSAIAAPHFRMFTNTIGGGMSATGWYFPHDEFYDASSRDVVERIGELAADGAVVAAETPGLYEYYARKTGRPDLRFVSLSDPTLDPMAIADFVVIAEGRRYQSNDAYRIGLEQDGNLVATTTLASVTSARIYQIGEKKVGR